MRALLKSEVQWVSGGLYSNTVEEIIVEAPTNDNDWDAWLDVWTPDYMDDVFNYDNDDLGDGSGSYSNTIANMSIQNATHDDLENLKNAVKYLQTVPAAAALIARAEAAGITIVLNHNGDDRTVYTNPPTVYWDPTAAHFMENNALQSSSMALIHEISHALDHIQAAPTFDDYHNYEEKRVIDEVETPIAQALGEPTRDDHIDRGYVHLGDSDDHITF